MDVTELSKERCALNIAQEIQVQIHAELDLPCSIGIAPNKFLAKTASDMKNQWALLYYESEILSKFFGLLRLLLCMALGLVQPKKLNAHSIFTIAI